MISLYGFTSPNVLKVCLMLEELGLAYDYKPVDIFQQEQFADAFVALNPNGKVPVLIDPDGPEGPITLFESGAILLYLARKSRAFLPHDELGFLTVMQWLMFQVASIGPMFGQAVHFQMMAPPGNDYSTSRYITEVHRLFGVLEKRLGEARYLGGDDYSIADIATYPWGLAHERNKVDLAALPAVARWLGDIGARPAVVKTMAWWNELRVATNAARLAASPDSLDRLYGNGRYAKG